MRRTVGCAVFPRVGATVTGNFSLIVPRLRFEERLLYERAVLKRRAVLYEGPFLFEEIRYALSLLGSARRTYCLAAVHCVPPTLSGLTGYPCVGFCGLYVLSWCWSLLSVHFLPCCIYWLYAVRWSLHTTTWACCDLMLAQHGLEVLLVSRQ